MGGGSIGQVGMCVNYDTRSMSWLNLHKPKKMRMVSLWNELPWLHNVFQVGEVQICFGIVKNCGFSVLHNYSRMLYNRSMSGDHNI